MNIQSFDAPGGNLKPIAKESSHIATSLNIIKKTSDRLFPLKQMASDSNLISFKKPATLSLIPDTYNGFCGPSMVSIQHVNVSNDQHIEIIFKNTSGDQVVMSAIVEHKTLNPFSPNPVEIAYISTSPDSSSSSDSYSSEILDPDGLITNGSFLCPISTDWLDDIEIRISPSHQFDQVLIEKIIIRLNGNMLLEKTFSPAFFLHRFSPLKLDRMIFDSRLSVVNYNNLIPKYGAMSFRSIWYIFLTATKFGQAWTPEYGPWPDGDSVPKVWCSEYIAYVLSSQSKGRYNPNPALESLKTTDLLAFFHSHNAPIIDASNTLYEELGNIIKPGFYVKLNRGGHSTLFVDWVDENGNPTEFKPEEMNHFMTIGGNEGRGGTITTTQRNSISKEAFYGVPQFDTSNPGDWPNIVWENNEDYTGAGNNFDVGLSIDTNLDCFVNLSQFSSLVKSFRYLFEADFEMPFEYIDNLKDLEIWDDIAAHLANEHPFDNIDDFLTTAGIILNPDFFLDFFRISQLAIQNGLIDAPIDLK